MEKSDKTEKGISFVLDVRTIPLNGLKLHLQATPEECCFLAERYELPAVYAVSADLEVVADGELIDVHGVLSGRVRQTCVVSLEEFDNVLEGEFHALFSANRNLVLAQENKADFDPEEEPIEFIPKGQIYFKEVIAEQVGLNINPFPKKTDEIFTYYEVNPELEKENPFSVLKDLTKF